MPHYFEDDKAPILSLHHRWENAEHPLVEIPVLGNGSCLFHAFAMGAIIEPCLNQTFLNFSEEKFALFWGYIQGSLPTLLQNQDFLSGSEYEDIVPIIRVFNQFVERYPIQPPSLREFVDFVNADLTRLKLAGLHLCFSPALRAYSRWKNLDNGLLENHICGPHDTDHASIEDLTPLAEFFDVHFFAFEQAQDEMGQAVLNNLSGNYLPNDKLLHFLYKDRHWNYAIPENHSRLWHMLPSHIERQLVLERFGVAVSHGISHYKDPQPTTQSCGRNFFFGPKSKKGLKKGFRGPSGQNRLERLEQALQPQNCTNFHKLEVIRDHFLTSSGPWNEGSLKTELLDAIIFQFPLEVSQIGRIQYNNEWAANLMDCLIEKTRPSTAPRLIFEAGDYEPESPLV